MFLIAFPSWLRAQSGSADLARAFELERRGRYAEAATQYQNALSENPAHVAALLGLERVLTPLNQLENALPLIDSALVVDPRNRSIRTLGLRIWGALIEPDSLSVAAREWIAAEPRAAEPFSEWARVLLQIGELERARAVIVEGVETIGDVALSEDMAKLAVEAGDWLLATAEWHAAVLAKSSLFTNAVSSLTDAPPSLHAQMIDQLVFDEADRVGGRLAADLLVSWGQPVAAWPVLDEALPDDLGQAVSELRRFADRVRLLNTSDGARARGFALERMSQIAEGPAAERARVEAARAFVDAGDRQSAERMLSQMGRSPGDEQSAAGAVATLIRVMSESGRVDEAEQRFREWEDRLSVDDALDLRIRLAAAWVDAGKLDRAERIAGADSSVGALAIRGWIALYRGDLRAATELFRAAGPHSGSRAAATARTSVLALIQQVEPDTVPELGEALMDLNRADTARAVQKMGRLAETLPKSGGRSDVLAFAGRLAVDAGDPKRAEPILLAAIEAESKGAAAAAAYYELARAYRDLGRDQAAAERLEFLILNFPESAMLPLARRLFDQLQGRTP